MLLYIILSYIKQNYILYINMSIQARVQKIYKADNIFFFGGSLFCMLIGAKICDYIFYDENKLLK